MRTTFSFLAKVLGKSKIFPSIVLTSEYRTTKACPCCRSPNSKMVQPRGNATYDDKNGVERRKRIHGLSQCCECGRLWSRDYAASLNIGRSFVSHFHTGKAEDGGKKLCFFPLTCLVETTWAQCARRSSCPLHGVGTKFYYRWRHIV